MYVVLKIRSNEIRSNEIRIKRELPVLICIFHSRSTTVECKNYWNLSIGNWQKIGDLLTGSKTQQCNILASALWQYRLKIFQWRDTKIDRFFDENCRRQFINLLIKIITYIY